jgi:hypothetical protein
MDGHFPSLSPDSFTRKPGRGKDMIRVYAALAAIGLFAGATLYAYVWGYSSGKQAVLAKLQADRIVLMKDGRRIDDEVLSADDSELLCLLVGNCVQPDAQ